MGRKKKGAHRHGGLWGGYGTVDQNGGDDMDDAGYGVVTKGNTTYNTFCDHEGILPVVRRGHITLGGANSYGIDVGAADMILDCADVVKSRKAFVANGSPEEWTALNTLVMPSAPVVKLEWQDRGIPPVGVPFWRAAWQLIIDAAKGKDRFHVIACCIGGHGRTGTALASLLVSDSSYDADDVIGHIRARHCKKAVESEAQERYIHALAFQRDKIDGKSPPPVGSALAVPKSQATQVPVIIRPEASEDELGKGGIFTCGCRMVKRADKPAVSELVRCDKHKMSLPFTSAGH